MKRKENRMEKRIESRIRVLKSRAKDNSNVIKKLERKLRKIKGENN